MLKLPWFKRRTLEKSIAFVRRARMKADVLVRGHVRCTMPLRGNTNHVGTMYAGALFTLAEMPGGGLWLGSFDTERFIPLLKEMNIRFLRAARTDVTVEVRLDEARIESLQATANELGKVDFVLDAELKDANGETVAVSQGVYQLRKRQR